MASLGWFGFGLREDEGGAGFSIAEEVLAFREFGRVALTPSVLATSLAAVIAARAGDKGLAAALASGKTRAALGHLLGASAKAEIQLFDAADCDWICFWSADCAGLSSAHGAGLSSAHGAGLSSAHGAGLSSAHGAGLSSAHGAGLSSAHGAGLSSAHGAGLYTRQSLGPITTRESLDASVTLGRAPIIGKPSHWIEASREALPRRAELLVAAQLTGMAEAARDMAAGYAKLRVQFGKPIGSFQSVAHHCADMALRAEAATSQLYFAAIAERDGRADATHQVAAALLVAGDAAFQNATLNIRVHGGIGFTAECDAHNFLKRTVLYRAITGGAAPHQQRLLATASTL
jgi:hypothetical protein